MKSRPTAALSSIPGRRPLDLPPPPSRLSAEAKGWWGKINAEYQLDDTALLLLEQALESLDRVREAQRLLTRDGLVLKDRWGQLRPNPASVVERDAKTIMARLLKQLNLDLEPLAPRPGRPPSDPGRRR